MNKFEKMYQYLEPVETPEADLLAQFKAFLEEPWAFGGVFCVRWKENERLYNTLSLADWVSTIKKPEA